MIRHFQASFGRVKSEVPVILFSTSGDKRRWSPWLFRVGLDRSPGDTLNVCRVLATTISAAGGAGPSGVRLIRLLTHCVPPRGGSDWRGRWPHRTTYVCASFAVDKYSARPFRGCRK